MTRRHEQAGRRSKLTAATDKRGKGGKTDITLPTRVATARSRSKSLPGGSGKTATRSASRPLAAPIPASHSSGEQATGQAASRLIDKRIRDLGGWRGKTLARMRALILQADPEMTEEWKWMGTPVWSHHGIVCTGEAYAKVVKLTFARGASIPDPARLFNSSLEGNTRRAIDIHEGETVAAGAFRALVKAAVARNASTRPGTRPARPIQASAGAGAAVVLAGGNPRIAKADGDAPVQAYIAAMPGWKRDVGRRLDELIVRHVPDVHKAVKWNSPFYGIEGQGWFLSFHTFTRYVKVAFFRGTSLRPIPPGASKGKDTRYLDIQEGDKLDEELLARWVKQAAALPGWHP